MSRICVTGAGGYIGRHVVEKLLAMNRDVIGVDVSFPTQNLPIIYKEMNLFSKVPNLYDHLCRPEILIHLAWRNGFAHQEDSHIDDLPHHYHFLDEMLKSGVQHLSVMGTMHEIGFWEGEVNENTPCKPLNIYGISKNALRELCIKLIEKYPFASLRWLRAYYIFGDDDANHSLFSKISSMEKEGKTTFPFTSGENKFDFIHVDELSEQIALAAIQNQITGIINVCSGKPVALKTMVDEYINRNHFRIRPEYGVYPNREGESKAKWGNAEKINKIKEMYRKSST